MERRNRKTVQTCSIHLTGSVRLRSQASRVRDPVSAPTRRQCASSLAVALLICGFRFIPRQDPPLPVMTPTRRSRTQVTCLVTTVLWLPKKIHNTRGRSSKMVQKRNSQAALFAGFRVPRKQAYADTRQACSWAEAAATLTTTMLKSW